MDFLLTEDQTALYTSMRDFASAELQGGLEARDRRGTFDEDEWRGLWRKLAARGVLGLVAPPEYGGAGLDIPTACCVLQGLGHGCRDNGLLLAVNAAIWTVIQPIVEFGTAEQKRRYLPGLIEGSIIGADAVTEADSGSDAMNVRTTAAREVDAFVLTGEKIYVGAAPACDLVVTFASTKPEAGLWGVTAFLVDSAVAGVRCVGELDKAGLRTNANGTLAFEGARLPADAVLGAEGAGGSVFSRSSEWERQMIFSSHVGAMRRQLDASIDFARRRQGKGGPIERFQSVSNRLADMRVRYETARVMQMRAAWQMQAGQGDALQAAVTKLHLSEAILASAQDAARIFGGQGYLFDSDAARDARDALGGVFLGGTSDIMRQIISSVQSRLEGPQRSDPPTGM